jgi:outer membrane protein TolC
VVFGVARCIGFSLFALVSHQAIAVETATTAIDPLLAELIEQSLTARPELARAKVLVRAEKERIAQAGALPDPTLSLGIQNDGFKSIEIGNMETSFLAIVASQTFPWPGKRALREDIARLGAGELETGVARLRLSTIADVRRAYLGLLLARERLALLDQLALLWEKSEHVARARYESGEGAQSDLLRAQLERARLKQRRSRLRAEEATWVQRLNRLRARAPDEPIATTVQLKLRPRAAVTTFDAELATAESMSPELAAARIGIDRADRGVELADRSFYPDLSVSAGVMPRGSLPPMWQATVAFSIPIFAASKQARAAAENEARAGASRQTVESIALSLRERVAERQTALAAALEILALYEGGLLTQSRATAESTLAQYEVGRVSFASVLEAIAGYLGDQDAHLQTIADAEQIAIARDEISLDPLTNAAGQSMGSGSMPGAGPTASGRSQSTPTDSSMPSEPKPGMGM